MLILRTNEDTLIDGMRQNTDFTPVTVTQADTPGRDLQSMGGFTPPPLPDPTVGGENGSRIRNGFSAGFWGRRARWAAFDGRVATLPSISNPIQGQVGVNARATSTYVGVLSQLAQYNPNGAALARSITGV